MAFVQILQSKQSFKQQEITKNMGYKYRIFRNQHVMLNIIRVWGQVEENPVTSYGHGLILHKHSQKMKE